MKHWSFVFFFGTNSYDISPELLISDLRFSTGSGKNSLCEHKQIIQVVHIQLERKKNQTCKLENLDETSPFQRMNVVKDEMACFLRSPLEGKPEKQIPKHPRDEVMGARGLSLRLPTCQAWMESVAPWAFEGGQPSVACKRRVNV